jgi:uncharacterized protein (DUF305 family)
MKISTVAAAAALALSVGLAGCAAGSDTPAGSSTMNGMGHHTPTAAASLMPGASPDHNQADIMFAQMMIPHHAQAVEMKMIGHHEGAVDMAQQEIEDGKDPEAVRLARDIITAQEAEIAEMKALLAAL